MIAKDNAGRMHNAFYPFCVYRSGNVGLTDYDELSIDLYLLEIGG